MNKYFYFILFFGIYFNINSININAQQSPLFVGAGVSFSSPQTDNFAEKNESTFGGTLFVGSRKYCSIWTGIRLDYTKWSKKTENTQLYFEEMVTISPEIRWFPVTSQEFLFYLQVFPTLNSTTGKDQLPTLGFGGGTGVGLLLPYENNCSTWFFDINARYIAPNFILKNENRPVLNNLNVSITFNIGL